MRACRPRRAQRGPCGSGLGALAVRHWPAPGRSCLWQCRHRGSVSTSRSSASAVNEATRIENLTKIVGQPVLASQDFARSVSCPLVSVGKHIPARGRRRAGKSSRFPARRTPRHKGARAVQLRSAALLITILSASLRIIALSASSTSATGRVPESSRSALNAGSPRDRGPAGRCRGDGGRPL